MTLKEIQNKYHLKINFYDIEQPAADEEVKEGTYKVDAGQFKGVALLVNKEGFKLNLQEVTC